MGCGESDAPVDGGVDSSVPDALPPAVVCEVPDVAVAMTEETAALADEPARCGQEPYRWLRGSELGEVLDAGVASSYPVAVAAAALQEAGVMLDAPPTHRVATRIIAYRTQERGRLVDATALVAYPTDMPRGEPLDVVLFLHGTTRFADGCGASTAFEYTVLSALMAGFGYMVVLPDFIGLAAEGIETGIPHPYVIGEPTAHASLDAVRAAMRLSPMDRGQTCARPRVVAAGVSQGGHAALWVDRLAPYYAQELELVGSVAIVPPAHLVRHAERGITGEGTRSLSLLSAVMLAANASWYGTEDRLDEVLMPPLDVDLPAQIWSTCDVTEDAVPTDLAEVFTAPLREAAAAENMESFAPWGCQLAHSDLLLTDIAGIDEASRPILFVTGQADDLVSPELQRASYVTLCDERGAMRYLECAGAGHVEALIESVPETLEFFAQRFAGEDFAADCVAGEASMCRGAASP